MNKFTIYIAGFIATVANANASRIANTLESDDSICAHLRYLDRNPADRSATTLALIELTALRLDGLKLGTVPEMLEKMPKPSVGKPTGKKVLSSTQTIPKSLGRLSKLRHLNLKANKLNGLPTFVCNLTNLRELNCEQNLMNDDGNERAVPERLCRLTQLEELSFALNKIRILPRNLGFLHNLVVLDIAGNNIAKLPASFARLHNLKQLFAASNQISSLPSTFGQLHKLDYLDLSENHFTTFPEPILNLVNLQGLYLLFNELTNIPDTVYRLSALKVLNLYENKLHSIPEQMAQMSSLRLLDIRNNSFVSIPSPVLELGKDVVVHNCTFSMMFEKIEGYAEQPMSKLPKLGHRPEPKIASSMYTYNSSYEEMDEIEVELHQASKEDLETIYLEAMALADLAKALLLTKFGPRRY